MSLPLLSAVRWRRPKEGVWVLNFRITDAGPYFIGGTLQPALGALVAVRPDGVDRRTRLLGTPPGPDEIEAAIRDVDVNHS